MQKHTASGATEVLGNVDLLWEILIRLPLKPLIQSKCVSKRWLTLISDQRFRDAHSIHQHRRYPTSLIFSNMYDKPSQILSFTTATIVPKLRVLELNFPNEHDEVIVVRSCNGRLLCRGYGPNYFIYNPISGNLTTLTPWRPESKSIDFYLAFDPCISPDYKVISVAQLNSPLHWIFNVYSFKTGLQIGPDVPIEIPFEVIATDGVYCSGAIYWCCGSDFSVYFDVDTQTLKNFPMPLSYLEWRNQCIAHFEESAGHLYLILCEETLNLKELPPYDIFELKEDRSGWLLRHRVDLNPLRGRFPQIRWYCLDLSFYIVRTVKDEKLSFSVLILDINKDVGVLYDPVDKASTKLCDHETVNSPEHVYSWGFFSILKTLLL
ncbi:F-box protein At5g07610-like [Lotus japonicus]|uniref:F-box protein At5g07610-like n=1 Tax=Lotus japonicus TaxID=34305 RepID=UPI00258E2E50|nr:F-box protein At5g07610-like [Lotus japonicus]